MLLVARVVCVDVSSLKNMKRNCQWMNNVCLLRSIKKGVYEQWFLVIKTRMTLHHFTIKPQVLNIMVGSY